MASDKEIKDKVFRDAQNEAIENIKTAAAPQINDNIVDFPDPALELKYTEYFTHYDKVHGVRSEYCAVELDEPGGKNFCIGMHGEIVTLSREELAEFLHVALCFVDSENRYKPKVDLIGVNYDD